MRHHVLLRHRTLRLGSAVTALCAVMSFGCPAQAGEGRKSPLDITEPSRLDMKAAQAAQRAASEVSAAQAEARHAALRQALSDPRLLLLKADTLDPLTRQPRFPEIGPHDLSRVTYPSGTRRYYIVQFDGPVRAVWFDALLQAEAEALAYLPNNAYVVRADPTHQERLEALANVRWVGEFLPGYKIDPDLARELAADPGTEPLLLSVSTFRGTSANPLRPLVVSLDPSADVRHVSDTVRGTGRLIVGVQAASAGSVVAALAREPDVEWISAYHLPEPLNDESTWVIQSGDPVTEATPLWARGLTGAGQIYAAADSGLDTDACQARLSAAASAQTLLNTTQPPAVNVTNPGNKVRTYYLVGAAQAYDDDSAGFHGTHTTGNAVGDDYATLAGPGDAGHDPGDGMAPAATVVFQDVGQHDGSLDGLSVGHTALQQQAHDSGARIHNDSYGIPAGAGGDQNTYDLDSQDLDETMWRLRHYTLFFSAGNDGPSPGGLGGGGSTAKNTLSVAATTHGSLGAEGLASFSSHGPASDGRIKPDLAAPGESIVSATEDAPVGGQSQTDPPNNNCATSPASGTSFASPTLAGAGLLVRQYFSDGFHPSGSATPADARDPSNALVKAVLLNSGRNLTGAFTASNATGGASAPRPNFAQGWGRVTLDDALFFPDDLRELTVLNDALNGEATVAAPAVTAAIQTGQVHEFTLPNVSTVEELRVALNWSDPAGSTIAAAALVNNLDLEVVDPNGVLYKGNVNFVDGSSTPAGAAPADVLNSVENVFIPDPVSGTYTIRVRGTNVPGNGTMSPFASNRQGYALIATGNFSYGNAPLIRHEAAQASGGKDGDAFLDRAEAVDVALTVRNDGAGAATDVTVAVSVDPTSAVPSSAVVMSPAFLAYGTVASKATATKTFSIALLNDGNDYSNSHLALRVEASAAGASTMTELVALQTMTDTATTPLFNFESGLSGWTLQKGTGGPPSQMGPGVVTCEASGARPTPTTELKFGRLNCTSDYDDNQDQRAISPPISVPLTNSTQLVSLNFWHRVGTESFFDFAQVFLDHNNDGTFHFVVDYNGPDTGQMAPFSAPLDAFFNTGRTEQVKVLFRLLTDFSVTAFPGWFVDDVTLTTKSADPVAGTAPTLIAVNPASGAQGTPSVPVNIAGLNTNFAQGVSAVDFSGSGVTVNGVAVSSPTSLTADVAIDAAAALGVRTATITTGAQVATRAILGLEITPNQPPVLAPIGDRSVNENELLAFSVAATDPDGHPLTYSADVLPPAASLDAGTGVFSWTPDFTQAGSYPVMFTATDTGALSDSEAITITVANVNRPPVLDPVGNKTVRVGNTLTIQLAASDQDAGDVLTFGVAPLPPGATFEPATGLFQWTPASGQAGTYPVTFSVSDGDLTDDEAISITVNPKRNRRTVICTELYRQGLLSPAWYAADGHFGATMVTPSVLATYQRWATPVAALMARSRVATALVKPVALAWAQHMAFVMGAHPADSRLGRWLTTLGVPLQGWVASR